MAIPVKIAASLAKRAANSLSVKKREAQRRKDKRNLIILLVLIATLLAALIFGPILMIGMFTSGSSGVAAAGAMEQEPDCFTAAGEGASGAAGTEEAAKTLSTLAKKGQVTGVTFGDTGKATAMTIIGVHKGLKLPRQATIVALVTAMQESSLGEAKGVDRPNADGDTGPFQQRAKPGWYGPYATIEQNTKWLNDTKNAATVFVKGATVVKQYPGGAGPKGYHIPGLLDIKGWQSMPVTVAAQSVQRSAFGDAYAKWETPANKLYDAYYNDAPTIAPVAGAITNPPTGAVGASETGIEGCGPEAYSKMGNCPITPDLKAAVAGMKPDTIKVTGCTRQQFPKIKTFYGVREDSLPDHPSGRAVDIMISSAYPNIHSKEAIAEGDRIAKWLEAHQKELGIEYMIWNQRIWNVKRAKEGWRAMESRGSDTANHKDHVHVTTFGTAAITAPTGGIGGAAIGNGKAAPPLKPGTYSLGPSWHAYGSWASWHTGTDLAAPTGTPVYAVADGVIGQPNGIWQSGNNIVLVTAGGESASYWHLSTRLVNPGDKVKAGQQIGAVGTSGRAFGAHLHFEYYPAGVSPRDLYQSGDPVKWLAARGVKV